MQNNSGQAFLVAQELALVSKEDDVWRVVSAEMICSVESHWTMLGHALDLQLLITRKLLLCYQSIYLSFISAFYLLTD